MSKRERRWGQIVQSYLKSGESLGAYCRRRGLNHSSTYYWVRKLRDEEEKASVRSDSGVASEVTLPSGFIELVTAQPITKESQEYRIVLKGGRELILKDGFVPATVRSLIEVCESC